MTCASWSGCSTATRTVTRTTFVRDGRPGCHVLEGAQCAAEAARRQILRRRAIAVVLGCGVRHLDVENKQLMVGTRVRMLMELFRGELLL